MQAALESLHFLWLEQGDVSRHDSLSLPTFLSVASFIWTYFMSCVFISCSSSGVYFSSSCGKTCRPSCVCMRNVVVHVCTCKYVFTSSCHEYLEWILYHLVVKFIRIAIPGLQRKHHLGSCTGGLDLTFSCIRFSWAFFCW